MKARVIVIQELENKKLLEDLAIRRNFQGKMVTLKDLASINETYTERRSVRKSKGMRLSLFLLKKVCRDILEAREKVFELSKALSKK